MIRPASIYNLNKIVIVINIIVIMSTLCYRELHAGFILYETTNLLIFVVKII